MTVLKQKLTRQTWPPIVVGMSTIFVNLLTYSVFHPLLPDLIRMTDEYNTTSEAHDEYGVKAANSNITDGFSVDVEDSVVSDISLVTGIGSISVVVASATSSYLIRLLGYRVVMATAALMTVVTPLICCYGNRVYLLCLAYFFINFSYTFGYVLVFSIFANVLTHDSDRTKIVNLSTVIGSVAYVMGYAATSAVYEFWGRLPTFWNIAVLDIANAIAIMFVPLNFTHDLDTSPDFDDRETSGKGDEICIDASRRKPSTFQSCREHLTPMRNTHIQFVFLQVFLMYVAIGSLYTTGPEWVLRHLETSQWQTGLLMGLGAASEIIGVAAATLIVDSPRKRWIAILVCMNVMGLGFLVYPFPRLVWYLLPSEISIRCCKAMAFTFQASLYPYIFDRFELGNYSVGYSIFAMSSALGTIVGTFGSGWVIGVVGFMWMYAGLGLGLVLVSFTAVHFRLMDHPRNTMRAVPTTDPQTDDEQLEKL